YVNNVYQSIAFELAGRGGGDNTNTNSNWNSYPDSQMGAIALIRQTFIDADWQASVDQGKAAAPANALTPLQRTTGVNGAWTSAGPVLVFNTDDELEAFRAVKIAEEFSRPMVVLGCGTEFRRIDG